MRTTAIRQVCHKQFAAWLITLAVALLLSACGKQAAAPITLGNRTSTSLRAVDSATAGSISGTVHLDGPVPSGPAINMQSEAACAKAGTNGSSGQPVAVSNEGALANVVVYLTDGNGLARYRFDPPQTPVVLDQKGCMYEPRVVALMTHQVLEIRNSDATIHNVHAMPKANSEWNKAQPAGGAVLRTSFPKAELAIPFMCNVHPWMRAFVFVFDHPYFAVTSADGKFIFRNVPPGTYRVSAWQEKLGTQTQAVTVRSQSQADVSFRFSSSTPSK
ncbi:MAG TPA: carboxypeptidase regulatory-like domain-containing protein [Candidatus Acidoferrales bacterium]|nr:carboxypeptidase regulatory-like domain-containing protein [Candidatus Acidoferrales bacterium]